ncbi:tetratricopeptide repeat protein [Candidatus Aminicenantes bacterium AC-708-M15]|nr:tetratricopeptide repeat protein [SCandidatus Aminicenantes bacterium Aminicenantia_JdfR_composite]MCP2597477.1 tetratricopeptide repeat protein [Candidatus Aminicenantes bacterium AC-335-G13]MCP2604346.1 tetratricopeptide repeat protein [Candidatus Aminicenantes bacterium AC-708-M15]
MIFEFKKLSFIILLSILLLIFSPYTYSQAGLGKGRISGEVKDEKGNPIEGVLIVAESLRYKGTKLQTYSDKKGHFAIGGLGTGYWRITASKKGYTSSYIEMYVRQLRKNPPITFTLKKLTGYAALMADKESFEKIDRGNKLIEEGKYDEALQVFQDFLSKNPEIYQIHLNIGSCYLKKGDLDKAEEEFQFVLNKIKESFQDYSSDPQTSLRAFTGLGEIAIKKGDFESARNYFTKALEISPEDEALAYNVGEMYFAHQNIDEAIKYYELAIKIKSDWPQPYYKLGLAYINKGNFEKAIEVLKKFVELSPPDSSQSQQAKNIIATLEKMIKK